MQSPLKHRKPHVPATIQNGVHDRIVNSGGIEHVFAVRTLVTLSNSRRFDDRKIHIDAAEPGPTRYSSVNAPINGALRVEHGDEMARGFESQRDLKHLRDALTHHH